MNHNLTLELNEQIFAAIQQQAKTIGISPEQLATTILEQQFTRSLQLLLNETERNAARAKFERHFGTLLLRQC